MGQLVELHASDIAVKFAISCHKSYCLIIITLQTKQFSTFSSQVIKTFTQQLIIITIIILLAQT